MTATANTAKRRRNWRSWWAKQLIAWHWISAGISLAAMLLFAITGITLNHAGAISAEPVLVERSAQLPRALLPAIRTAAQGQATLPAPAVADIARQVGLDATGRPVEWSESEAYVALPRPGGDAWVSIDLTNGAIRAETTDRGWISYVNDLHKGRNAGSAWFWFIDVFAAACILFSITGLLLLQLHAKRRPSTWPLVAGGVALPVLLAVFFIH